MKRQNSGQMKKAILVVIFLAGILAMISGQNPSPSADDPHRMLSGQSGGYPGWTPAPNLLYNMQIIGKLKYPDGSFSLNANDRIGAFAGEVCRGVYAPDASLAGLIFLTVGANQQSGEAITFKAYLSEPDQVVTLETTMVFTDQQQVGSVSDPYLFSCPVTIPDTLLIQNVTVIAGETRCYEALRLIAAGGNGTSFQVEPGATVNLGSGIKVSMLPGTHFGLGSAVHVLIYPGGGFCNALQSKNGGSQGDSLSKPGVSPMGGMFFRIFPNPSSGQIQIEPTDPSLSATLAGISVFNSLGVMVLKKEDPVTVKTELDLSFLKAGVYTVRVHATDRVGVSKVIIR